MAHRKTGFWDFKNYSEKEWFKFLAKELILVGAIYMVLHVAASLLNFKSEYEYTRLSADQLQLINRMYFDTAASPKAAADPAKVKDSTPKTKADSLAAKNNANLQGGKVQPANGQKPAKTTTPKTKDSICTGKVCTYAKVMDYLTNEFNNKMDPVQKDTIRKFLKEAKPFEATSFLAGTRFKIESYFWLTGPTVYFEIMFWAFFGVVCSLLFAIGVVSKDASTTVNNPQSVFDPTEIPSQVAKMLYAPVCTLAVILGYNFFKDQNIVDISSSKGVIVFAFVGGFYSSRVISLLDRLKDVLLPNNGTTALPGGAAASPAPPIPVKLQVDESTVTAAELAAINTAGLNSATVSLKVATNNMVVSAGRQAGDPPATFTFKGVAPGKYTVTADCKIPFNDATIHLAAVVPDMDLGGAGPFVINLKKVS